MDAVLDNWLGPAIGGAIGVGAWLAGETVKGINTVVDTVTDLIQGTQPQPYEEWLNAPVPTQETTNDFRNPSNETTDTGLTAEEIISGLGVEETLTGTSSPNNQQDPEPLAPLPVQQPPSDPQAPLTSDFVPPPQTVPPTGLASNVLMDMFENGVIYEIQLPLEYQWARPIFRGIAGAKTGKAYDRFTFWADSSINADGVKTWKAKAKTTLRGRTQSSWSWDAGTRPPHANELKGESYLEGYGVGNWFEPADQIPGGWIRTYSLSEPVAPPVVEPPPVPDLPLEVPFIDTPPDIWQPLPQPDTTPIAPPAIPPLTTPWSPPPLPPQTVPIPANNPIAFPPIGNDGTVLPPPTQIITTPPDVHVINGTPINSGAIRNDISGVAKEVGRLENKAARILDRISNGPPPNFDWATLLLALQALQDLFEQPLPSKTFELQGVCEEPLEDGRQPSTSVILPPEKWADRVISLGDVVPDLLQAHLGYKTPTCGSTKPQLEGDWVTTRWISDEKMDHSGKRLRKLLRYRSKSSRDLGQLSSYWRTFTWSAGPVCVIHKGAWWGTPQVWASTPEEGKRVLRFAAAEAGLDPDQVGGWEISGSRSPRYGMSGTMRIHMHKGFPWVASRDGPSWPNYLAKEA